MDPGVTRLVTRVFAPAMQVRLMRSRKFEWYNVELHSLMLRG